MIMNDYLKKNNMPFNSDFLEEVNIAGSSVDVQNNDIAFISSKDDERTRKYIKDSIDRNASYVFVDCDFGIDNPKVITLNNFDEVYREIVSLRYPAYKNKSFHAVTGTNGKTTVASYIKTLMGGETVEFIGTTQAKLLDEVTHMPGLTTPEFIDIARIASKADSKERFILEVSSHSLVKERLGDIFFDVASFTNLSNDHLDFHKDLEDYFNAKCLLFEKSKSKFGVITSGFWGDKLMERIDIDYVSVGFTKEDFASFYPTKWEPHSIEGNLFIDGKKEKLILPIYGAGAIENFLVACVNVYLVENSTDMILENVKNLKNPKGRYQPLPKSEGSIIIDYAHTPEALISTIEFTKRFHKEVVVVFGCGGDRDPTKRELMGRAASEADKIILTSDNPRNEDPQEIINDILKGIINKKDVEIVVDRSEAIAKAINENQSEEVILILGRGHESHQEIKGQFIDFDDYKVALSVLENLK